MPSDITTHRLLGLCNLEGRVVSLALTDGSCLKKVMVVSAGRGGVPTVWLEKGGVDTFINRTQIIRARNPQHTHPGGPIEVRLHPHTPERLVEAHCMDLEREATNWRLARTCERPKRLALYPKPNSTPAASST